MLAILVAACSASDPSLPTSIATRAQFPPAVTDSGLAPTVIVTPAVPTSSFPPDWTPYNSESPRLSLYYSPGWTLVPGTFHIEIYSPSRYSWAEMDVLSPDNPGLAGEPLAAGGDFGALTSQLESALRENGTFNQPETYTQSGNLTKWIIEGSHDSFGENVVVSLIASGTTTYQFIGHQGDGSEDWDSLRVIYRQIIESISF